MSFSAIINDLKKLRDDTQDPEVRRTVRRTIDKLHSYEALTAEVSVFARSIVKAVDARHGTKPDEEK